MPAEFLDDLLDHGRGDGLGEVGGGAEVECLADDLFVILCGADDALHGGESVLDRVKHLVAVHLGHDEIEQEEVVVMLRNFLHAIPTIHRVVAHAAESLQNSSNEMAESLVVVRNQNSHP